MNPPTLLRKFISLFWLKKDCFQLAINKPKHGNREKSSRRRRLKIVLGLLLLMKPCWSFWNLLNTSLVGILLKMVMLKLLIVQKLWELLIHIMIERSFTWELLLWRGKEFGGCLRWIMTWTRKMFPQVWKKKLKYLFQSSYLQSVLILPRHHSWHLRLLKNSWNTSWTLWMAVMPREENLLACVVCMLTTCSLQELQSFWRSSRKLSSHNSRLVMKMWLTWCSLVNVWNGSLMRRPRRNHTSLLNNHFVSVNLLRLSYQKVWRMKTNVTRISTLPTDHS